MTNRRRRFVLTAVLAAGVLAAALALGTARSAPARAFAAAIDVTQTCTARVKPNTTVNIQAVVANTGDVQLTIAPNLTGISADAGTPLDESDDFSPAYSSGDVNNNQILDPGEQWTYTGSFTAGTEDLTDIVDVDAIGVVGGEDVSDLANCDTDVIQTPQPGVIVGVQKVAGKVLVKQPGGKWVPLDGPTEIKVGSSVDTTHGTIKLIAGLGGGKTNSANFNDGLFKIQQSHARNAYMVLIMQGGNFGVCRGRTLSALSVDAKRRRQVRRLWGNGHGRFTTKGRYSSATVRGTHWLVQDRCDGTLTRVLRGVVQVKDFRHHKTVSVRAGHSYLATAP